MFQIVIFSSRIAGRQQPPEFDLSKAERCPQPAVFKSALVTAETRQTATNRGSRQRNKRSPTTKNSNALEQPPASAPNKTVQWQLSLHKIGATGFHSTSSESLHASR